MPEEVKRYAEMTAEERRIPKDAIPILSLHLDPKTGKFCFIGYESLMVMLRNGACVEEYLRKKIETVRKTFIQVV